MSGTLVTTAAGSSAAGSEGVTDGSTGDPKQGEPNPTPFPANPAPETLQYVTVYDNHDHGGFAGSKPVTSPENFRCSFDKVPGAANLLVRVAVRNALPRARANLPGFALAYTSQILHCRKRPARKGR